MQYRAATYFLVAGLLLGAAGARAEGDPVAGKKSFRQCGACHGLAPGKKKLGPPLNAIIGRAAASAPNFKYSASFVEAGEKGLVWDEDNLMAYLENPKAFIKTFLGKDKIKIKMLNRFKKEDLRRNVIAYLKEVAK